MWNGVPENMHLMICLMHKALVVQPLTKPVLQREEGESV